LEPPRSQTFVPSLHRDPSHKDVAFSFASTGMRYPASVTLSFHFPSICFLWRGAWRRTIPFVLGSILAATAAAAAPKAGAPKAAAPSAPDRYRRTLEEGVANGVYDAVAVGLIDGKEQKTWFFGKNRDALSERSAFEIGAVTEVFTGILLAQAVLDGKLRLTDPVGSLLPADFPWADPEFAATQVVALATQTSGLPATPANLFPVDPDDAYADYTEGDLLAFLANYRPGEWKRDYAYSPLNGALLCVLLGKLYENGCSTLLISKVLDPLGLSKTGFGDPAELLQGHAYGRDAHHWHFKKAMAGAAGLRSTLQDLLAFLSHNLHPDDSALRGALLLARQARSQAAAGGLGLGWTIHDVEMERQTWPLAWRASRTGGFSTFIGFRTDRQQALVLLANSSEDLASLGIAWLTGETPPPASPPPFVPDAARLARYAGLYRLFNHTELIVSDSGSALRMQVRGQPAWPLFAVAEDSFVTQGGTVGLSFIRNIDEFSGLLLRTNGQFVTGERLSARAPRLQRAAITLDASRLAVYAGDYRLDADTLLRITVGDDGLGAQLSGAARSAMRAYATDRFADADGQNGLIFERDEKGRIVAVVLDLAGGERKATPANWRAP
jgi:D-alanyl-D-alanine-carboxypeptidase/D-alanyl-D-alanine-endopeptidase